MPRFEIVVGHDTLESVGVKFPPEEIVYESSWGNVPSSKAF